MYDFGPGHPGPITPLAQGVCRQYIHVVHIGAAAQHLLQSLEATALHAHLLSVRQHFLVMHLAQRERKTVPQAVVQLMAAKMARRIAACRRFALGDLLPLRTLAGDAARQQGFLEHTGPRYHFGELLPVGGFVHKA